jgi:hypothetical protein
MKGCGIYYLCVLDSSTGSFVKSVVINGGVPNNVQSSRACSYRQSCSVEDKRKGVMPTDYDYGLTMMMMMTTTTMMMTMMMMDLGGIETMDMLYTKSVKYSYEMRLPAI